MKHIGSPGSTDLRVGVFTSVVNQQMLANLFSTQHDRSNNGQLPSSVIFGRLVYVREFLEALVRHGQAEYHLIVPYLSRSLIQTLSARCSAMTRGRVMVHGPFELADLLRSGTLDVLHDPGGESYRFILARNQFSRRPTPITEVIHSLGNSLLPFHDIVRICGGSLPVDTLIAPSAACAEAINRRLNGVRQNLSSLGLTTSLAQPRTTVIPLGVETNAFSPCDRVEARARFGWSHDYTIALYLGRFSPFDKADLLPLMRAFASVKSKLNGPMKLVLAGDDRRYGYARQVLTRARCLGLGEGIELLDEPVPPRGPYKQALLSAADFFVSPIDNGQETFGLTLLEAMAASLPIIASNLGGYRDIVRDGLDGFLIPTWWCGITSDLDSLSPLLANSEDGLLISQGLGFDMDALARAMDRLANDVELRLVMGRSGRSRVTQLFDWHQIMRRYESFWQDLVKEARSSLHKPSIRNHDQCIASMVNVKRELLLSNFTSLGSITDLHVQTTDRGWRLVEGEEPLTLLYAELEPVIQIDLIGVLLRKAEYPITVRDLCDQASPANRPPIVPKDFLISWLLKHGYLALAR